MSLYKKMIRLMCLRRHRSRIPTGFVPLSEVRTAVVFFDESDPHCEPLKLHIKDYFGKKEIEVRMISAFDRDIRTSSDLFIALNGRPGIDERYAACSSGARFKVGRHPIKGNVYDLVLTDTGEEPSDVADAFAAIENMLEKIQ